LRNNNHSGSTRCIFRLLFIAVFVLFVMNRVSAKEGTSSGAKPNILIITLDTTRADHLPCYGYSLATMPFLSSIAQTGGIIYEKAFTTAPLTYPAHVSLFTGLEPQHHLILDNGFYRLGKDKETLATLAKKAGYTTFAYVSAAILDKVYGLNQGFDLYDDTMRMGKSTFSMYKERSASQVVDSAIKSMNSWRPPYFTWIHFYDPHDPYIPPAPYNKQFKNPYDGELAFMDSQIKRLFEILKSSKIWHPERDWAIIVGDHGEDLGDFGELHHGLLLTPPTIKIPMIILKPGLKGSRNNSFVSITDVAPTVLELLNFPDSKTQAKMDGTSLNSMGKKHPPLVLSTLMPYLSFRWSPLIGELDYPYLLVKGSKNVLINIELDPKMLNNLTTKEKAAFTSLNSSLEKIKDMLMKVMNPDLKNIENLEQIRSLGYVGSAGKNMPAEPFNLPDPKDKIWIYRKFMESKKLIIEQRWDEASKEYSVLLKADPSNTLVLNALGTIYENMGEIAKAESSLLKVKDLIPDMDYPYLHLGEFYMIHDRLAEAEKYFRTGLQKNRRNTDIYLDLVQIALLKKDLNAALSTLNEAENNGIKDLDLFLYKATFSRNKGAWQDAANALNNAESLDPTDGRIIIEKGYLSCEPQSPFQNKCESFMRKVAPESLRTPELWTAAAEWYNSARQYGKSLYCWLEAYKRPMPNQNWPKIIQKHIQLLQSKKITPVAPDWVK